MKNMQTCLFSALMSLPVLALAAPIPVTVDNFVRAESDLYFQGIAQDKGFAKFNHFREPTPLDKQTVIRLNRDTLYSSAVFDLDAGPVSITLPNAGKRFMSMQVISQDHYTPLVVYKPGTYTLSKQNVGTRYAVVAIRIFVDPNQATDVKTVTQLQDKIKVSQPKGPGKLEFPQWDQASQKATRDHLLALNQALPDTNDMFGKKEEVKPIRHLIGSASAWGGNPQRDATYLNGYPAKNDGKTIHYMTVPKNVPVDGFWSITVYDKDGFFQPNAFNSYSLNNITAKPSSDGSYQIQFGGCSKTTVNCLPITNGWNYLVRLYQPQDSILKGTWKFPVAQPK